MTQTILVTGGLGFIGSHFVRLLLQERPELRVVNLDKLTYAGNPDNLAEVRCRVSCGPQHNVLRALSPNQCSRGPGSA